MPPCALAEFNNYQWEDNKAKEKSSWQESQAIQTICLVTQHLLTKQITSTELLIGLAGFDVDEEEIKIISKDEMIDKLTMCSNTHYVVFILSY